MTSGERAVWAAVYAVGMRERWRYLSRDLTPIADAARDAHAAVVAMRKLYRFARTATEFMTDEELRMLRCMVEADEVAT